MRSLPLVLALALALPLAARAQEMGLDLTDTTDYRPTLAIIGIAPTDPAVPPEMGEKLKVDKVAARLVETAQKSDLFSAVTAPADAFGKLSDNYGDALKCSELDCMQKLAAQLDVNVVMLGQLVKNGTRTVMKLYGYTRYSDAVDSAEVPAGMGPGKFELEATNAFTKQIDKARGMQLGYLEVKSGTPGATGKLDGQDFGSVPGKRLVPPGAHALKVEAPGYLADDIDAKVEAGKSVTIESNLVQKPPDLPQNPVVEAPPVVEKPAPSTGKPIWLQPGAWVAAGGVALAVTGVIVGSSAKGIESKMVDANGDGVLDVTRRDVDAAKSSAMWANILVGVGAAAAAGGAVWVVMMPAAKPAPKPDAPPDASLFGSGVGGVMVGIRGELP